MTLQLNKIYKVVDSKNNRDFYVQVIDELCNWEYDYSTYKCRILTQGYYYQQTLILVTEMWDIYETSSLEVELL